MTQIVIAHTEEAHREPVDGRRRAALERGQRKGGQHRQPGRASISARSDPPSPDWRDSAVITTHQRHRQVAVRQVWRQRHSVHSASGQAGHRNHSHWRAMATSSDLPLVPRHQCQAPRCLPAARRSAVATSTQRKGAHLRVTRPPQTSVPPSPSPGPWPVRRCRPAAGSASSTARRGCQRRNGRGRQRVQQQATAASWASSGVVSWPSCSRPRRGHQRQHRAVGHGPGVVHRFGLAAEGKGTGCAASVSARW
jgi:hypothetical protein